MSYPKALMDALEARCDGMCERCETKPAGNVHHRLLKSRGGKDTPENCVAVCGTGTTGCHGWIHGHPAEATATGWMVPSWLDPAMVPAIPLSGQR